jgi:hypothetical protein
MIRNAMVVCWIAISLSLASPVAFASDTLLVNGHIYTANPAAKFVQAMAITGTRIDALGTNEEIMALKAANTRVIDLQQRTVIPGIVDSHVHSWFGALAVHGFNLATPKVYIEPKDEEVLVSRIKEYAASHPKEKILFGRVSFGTAVTSALLDRAVSDRPVIVHAPTEHSLWVNSKALELAGITEKPMADPAVERFVVRDASGRPTGILREAAMQLMDGVVATQPFEEQLAFLRDGFRYLNSFGITSVMNATGGLAELRLYATLRDRGQLTVRTKTPFGAVAVNHHLTPQLLADLDEARTTYNDKWVSANVVKFFVDGAGTGALYEPEEFKKLLIELDTRGYQIMTHTLSPDPGHAMLDAYEEVVKVNGPRDRRLRVEHGGSILADDVPRLGTLGVTASMQPGFCCSDEAKSGRRSNVWHTLLETGANLSFGSDWPCTFPPDPFLGIQQGATRAIRSSFAASNPTALPRFTSPEERLTVEQAVDAYTRASAYARFSEDYIGTLEPGKEADLAVLTQNIFGIRPELIGNTQVVMTMVGGKVVFDDMK